MKLLICEKCGGSDFFEQDSFRVCTFCRSKYAIQSEDVLPPDSSISVGDDVRMLLQKCQDDPANAQKYASLVLDIDPNNLVAQSYISKKKKGFFEF
jgi:hypothetical protein